jgi:hypothetical protein
VFSCPLSRSKAATRAVRFWLDMARHNVTLISPVEKKIMAERENVALFRRWFEEVWNRGRLEVIDEMLAPNAVGFG